MAQKRIALVIGNSSYANVRPLPNPANDATAIADLFRAANFDVVDASNNLGGLEMRRVFRDFAEKSRTADIAVVFYAGHGIEIDGTNYLLPVDTALKRDLDVEDEAVSIDRVVRTLEPAKRLRLIILDACRDNPFVRTVRRTSETRSIGRGLAKIEPPSSDTLIAFAAKAGSTASDGDGKHSPFTVALLKNLTTPGLDLRIALGRVRDDVMEATGNRQEPFVYGSLGGSTVTLVPAPPVAAAPEHGAEQRRRAPRLRTRRAGRHQGGLGFLPAIHSGGFYADLARGQRDKLLAEIEVATTHRPPTKCSAPSHRGNPAGRTATAAKPVRRDAIAPHHRDLAPVTPPEPQSPNRPRRPAKCTLNCSGLAATRARSTRRGGATPAARWSCSTGTPAQISTPSSQVSTRSVWCAPRPAGFARWNASRVIAARTRLASRSFAARGSCRRQWRLRTRTVGEIQNGVAAGREAAAPQAGRRADGGARRRHKSCAA